MSLENPGKNQAVFLDRDGTIIEDTNYLRDPAHLRLLPGAARAIARLGTAGLRAVVVTNQSGIARGLISIEEYRAGERRLDELLAQKGARLDAHYFCPHLPELSGSCECRKPGTLLYREAAAQFDLDLGRSWWIGDRPRDLLPGKALGGRGILVLTGAGHEHSAEAKALGFEIADDLEHAAQLILKDVSPD